MSHVGFKKLQCRHGEFSGPNYYTNCILKVEEQFFWWLYVLEYGYKLCEKLQETVFMGFVF